ncbi:MAG: MFS transporter, partial [Chloroflexi bacterium]|nr:MFS transporter [Chloroflexota bacterium]
MAADGVEPRPSPYRWVVMLTFNLTHATGIVGALVLGVLLPSMTADLGLSPSQQGWLGSSTMLGSLVLSIPLGWWLSRYRATWVTTVSLAAGTLFIFMQGLAPGFVVLLVARILFGLAPVAREPARMLLVHQWLPRREIPLFNGILNAIFGISVTGAFVAAPLLLKAFDDNWRGPLYVYGFFSIGLTLLWVLLGRDNPAGDRRPVESQEESPLRSVFRYREPWLVGLGMVG